MRISDWSSDVCSSDLECLDHVKRNAQGGRRGHAGSDGGRQHVQVDGQVNEIGARHECVEFGQTLVQMALPHGGIVKVCYAQFPRKIEQPERVDRESTRLNSSP